MIPRSSSSIPSDNSTAVDANKMSHASDKKTPLLSVCNLKTYFSPSRGWSKRNEHPIKAVDGVSFSIQQCETLGLVGESGCGKSTVGRSILRLANPTDGTIEFDGEFLTKLSFNKMRSIRKRIKMIFQDPYSSLNPRQKIIDIVSEPLRIHTIGMDNRAIYRRAREVIYSAGLQDDHLLRFPHELSGGERQRVGIARALAVHPKLIIADEAVSALDVSIQAQIINLLQEIKRIHHLTYLFISHDLSVIRHISDRVAVMYLGIIVEIGSNDDIFTRPSHPYTLALLSASPIVKPKQRRKRIILAGDIPSAQYIPKGCRFHDRCPWAQEICKVKTPPLRQLTQKHSVACHFAEKISKIALEYSG